MRRRESEREFRLGKEDETRSNIFIILCKEIGLYFAGSTEAVRGFKQGENTIRLAFWKKHREEGRWGRRETS